ncbi:hypothetical protein VTK73DRAFT_6179 [Phialemonium thermophilum]|uniref:Uncharacterized protein n=1 Tax=Phialemonium thermophilum TaxID=223376 RepID=A0ABR3UZW8_9PEZI
MAAASAGAGACRRDARNRPSAKRLRVSSGTDSPPRAGTISCRSLRNAAMSKSWSSATSLQPGGGGVLSHDAPLSRMPLAAVTTTSQISRNTAGSMGTVRMCGSVASRMSSSSEVASRQGCCCCCCCWRALVTTGKPYLSTMGWASADRAAARAPVL